MIPYTRGKWTIDPRNLLRVVCSNTVDLQLFSTSYCKDEAQANAKLISLLPEVFDSLRYIKKLIDEKRDAETFNHVSMIVEDLIKKTEDIK